MSSHVDNSDSQDTAKAPSSPDAVPSPPSASQFLLQHHVKEMLNDAVLALLRDRSDDPQAFLHAFFAPKNSQAPSYQQQGPTDADALAGPSSAPSTAAQQQQTTKPKPLDSLNVSDSHINGDASTPLRTPFIQVTESDSVVPSAAVSPSVAAVTVPKQRQVSVSVREDSTAPLPTSALGLGASMHRSRSIAMHNNEYSMMGQRVVDDDIISNRYDGMLPEVRGGVCAQRRREVPGVLPLNIGTRGGAIKAPVGSSPDNVLECAVFQHTVALVSGLVNDKAQQLVEAEEAAIEGRAPHSNEELLDGGDRHEVGADYNSTEEMVANGIPKLLLRYAVASTTIKDQALVEKGNSHSTSKGTSSPMDPARVGSRAASLLVSLVQGTHAKPTFIAFLANTLKLLMENGAFEGNLFQDLEDPLLLPLTPDAEEATILTPPGKPLSPAGAPATDARLSDVSRMLADLMDRLASLDPDGWLPDSEWVTIGSLFLFTYDESQGPAAIRSMASGGSASSVLADPTVPLSFFALPVWYLAGTGHPFQRRLGLELTAALESRYREPVALSTFLACPLIQLGARADTPEAELFLKARTLVANGDKAGDDRRATAIGGDNSLDNTQNIYHAITGISPTHKHTRHASEETSPIITGASSSIEVIAAVWDAITNYRLANQLPAIGIETFIGVEQAQTAFRADTSAFGSSPTSEPSSPSYNPSQALRRHLGSCSSREQVDLLQTLLTSEILPAGSETYVVSFDPQAAKLGRWIQPNQRTDGWRGGLRPIGRILVHTNSDQDRPPTYRQLLRRALTLHYGGPAELKDQRIGSGSSSTVAKPTLTESFLIEALHNSLRFMATDPVQSGPQQRVYGVGRGSHTFVQRAGGGRYGKGTVIMHKLISSASFNARCSNSHLYAPGKVVFYPGPVLGTASMAVKGWTRTQIGIAEGRAGNTHEPIRLPQLSDEAFNFIDNGSPQDMEEESVHFDPTPAASSLVFTIHSTSALLLGNYCHLPRAHDCMLGPAAPLSVRDQRVESEGDAWLQATGTVPQDFASSGLHHTPSGNRSQFLGLGSTPHHGNTPTMPHSSSGSAQGPSPVIRLIEMDDKAALHLHLKSQLRACPSAQSAGLVWQLLHSRVALEMRGGPSANAMPNWVLKHNSNESPLEEALAIWGLTGNMMASAGEWEGFVAQCTSGIASSSVPPSILDQPANDLSNKAQNTPPPIREVLEVLRASTSYVATIGSFMFFIHPSELREALRNSHPQSSSHHGISKYVWLDASTKKGQLVQCQGGGVSEQPISVRKSSSHHSLRALQVTDADVSFLCTHILPLSVPSASITITNSDTVTDAACEELICALCEDSNIAQVSLLGCRVSVPIQEEVGALAAALRSSSRGEVRVASVDDWVSAWMWGDKMNKEAAMFSPTSSRIDGAVFSTTPVPEVEHSVGAAMAMQALGRVMGKLPHYMTSVSVGGSTRVPFDAVCEALLSTAAQWKGIESLGLAAITTAEALPTSTIEVSKSNSSFGSNIDIGHLPTSPVWMSFLAIAPAVATLTFKDIEPFPVPILGSLCAAWRRRELEAEADAKEQLTKEEQEEMAAMAPDGLSFSQCKVRHLVFEACELPLEFIAHLATSLGPHTNSAVEAVGGSPANTAGSVKWESFSSIIFDSCYFVVPPQMASSLSLPPSSQSPTPSAHAGHAHTAASFGSVLGGATTSGIEASGSIPLSAIALADGGVSSSLGAVIGGPIATSFSSGLGGVHSAIDMLSPYLERFFSLGVLLEFRRCEGVPDTIVDGRGQ